MDLSSVAVHPARILADSLHDNSRIAKDGMVCQIWEDGEITLTKSGSLYGSRGLHMISEGNPTINIPMPVENGHGHTYAAVESVEIAQSIQKLMFAVQTQ